MKVDDQSERLPIAQGHRTEHLTHQLWPAQDAACFASCLLRYRCMYIRWCFTCHRASSPRLDCTSVGNLHGSVRTRGGGCARARTMTPSCGVMLLLPFRFLPPSAPERGSDRRGETHACSRTRITKVPFVQHAQPESTYPPTKSKVRSA